MFNLTDLKSLILGLIYSELEEDSNEKYNDLKDEVEQIIYRYTNYTPALIADPDHSEIKDQLRRPFAWVLEYYALSFTNDLIDLQEKRIFRNYQEAIEMLESFPVYDDVNETITSTNVDMEHEKW